MCEIYSQAREVQIFLSEAEGFPPDFNRLALRPNRLKEAPFLVRLPKNQYAFSGTFTSQNGAQHHRIWGLSRVWDTSNACCWRAFLANAKFKVRLCRFWYASLRLLSIILSRPWWKRVWVVQEVVLTPATTVHYGTNRGSLSSFLYAARNYQKHANEYCLLFSRLWHGDKRHFNKR